jgi:hypothetical protein
MSVGDLIWTNGKYCHEECDGLERAIPEGPNNHTTCRLYTGCKLASDGNGYLRCNGCVSQYAEIDEKISNKKGHSMKDTVGSAVQSVVAGVKAGGANAVNKRLIKILRDSLGEKYPAFFNDGLGKMLEPVLAPTLVMLIADAMGDGKLKDKINRTCKLALTGCGVELVGQMQDKHGDIAGIAAAIAAISDE